MCKFRLSIQALIIAYLCSALVACGGGSSSASTTAVTAYTITTTASTGGSVTPGSTTVNSGQTAKFTVSASNGYTVQSVTGCGGTLSGNTYITGPVTVNCTVNASFMPITYAVTANAGPGGTITPPSTTVNSGQTDKFTVSASNGYTVQSVTGCGGTLSGNTYITGPVTANCTVNASFMPITYTVTANAGPGGTITPPSTTVSSGQTTTFTVSANSGYAIQSVTGCSGTLAGTTYTTGPINSDCTVSTSYKPITYTVTSTASSGGTITPPSTTVNAGQTTAFNVIADSGYAIQNITGCGGTLSINIYTTGIIAENCSVTADFSPEWTWEGGSDLAGQPAVYGIEGVASADSTPGGRESAVSWVGPSDNLWLFGGKNNGSLLDDLWMYSSVTHEWTWEGGSDLPGQHGIYGAEGVPATTNIPGARTGAVSWKDAAGNFWLFGGVGFDMQGNQGYLNDLWMYSPVTREWTWEGGSDLRDQISTYGTEGVANVLCTPGARSGAVTWTDSNGNLWMLGGLGLYGYQYPYTVGTLNDLWMYSTVTHEWTWEGGGAAYVDQPGVYGTEGVPASTNMPGARIGADAWTGTSGNLWLFGGYGYYASNQEGELNDLWLYSTLTHEWTWEGGSDLSDQSGVYGTEGVPATTNTPGARSGAVSWTDVNGDVWLFGGDGNDSQGYNGPLNDLWMYSAVMHEWTWEGGSDLADRSGVYGTQGVAALKNIPGGRLDAYPWTDIQGDLWLFGGNGNGSKGNSGYLNDLWMYPKP